MPKLTEDDLLSLTAAEMSQSIGYRAGRLSEARRNALQYYLARPVGELSPPEVEGRSNVVATDVADVVEGVLPSLVKTFCSGDKVVEFQAQRPEDEQDAEAATEYVNYLFYRRNHGFNIIYTWFKDALISKLGIVKVWWESDLVEAREEYNGLNDLEFAKLIHDEDVTPIQHTARPDPSLPPAQVPQPDGSVAVVQHQLHDVVVKRRTDNSRVKVVNVPPEEFLISRDATSVENARFTCHQFIRTISDLKAMGYKNVDELTSDTAVVNMSPERIERQTYNDELQMWVTLNQGSVDESQRQVWVSECYLRVDYDGDGISEWRKITRVGNTIIDNEPCDGSPFVTITPIPLPHTIFGLSLADTAMQSQLINTNLIRALIDNTAFMVNGRFYAVDGQVNLDDMMTSRPGGVVRVKNPAAAGRLDQPQGDMGGAYQLLQYIDQRRQQRTGFYAMGPGMDADILQAKTATQVNADTSRANERIELIARVFAETGVKDLFFLILKLACMHQDRQAQIRVGGQWVAVDPRSWANKFDFVCNVGLGTGNKDQQVAHLTSLWQMQTAGLQLGIANPENLYKTACRFVNLLGFKGEEQFFTDPATVPPRQPQMPPEVMVQQMRAQADVQATQAKVQADIQKFQAEAQIDAQKDAAEMQQQATLKQQEIESQERIKAAEIASRQQEKLLELAAGILAAREGAHGRNLVAGSTLDQNAQGVQSPGDIHSVVDGIRALAMHLGSGQPMPEMPRRPDPVSGLHEAISQLAQSHAQTHELVSQMAQEANAPAEFVRDETGRAVAVKRGQKVRQVRRGPDGRVIGLQ